MQATLNDATGALLHPVRLAFANVTGFVLEEVCSRGWASVTFASARHKLCFRLEGEGAEDAADGFLKRLDPARFALPGTSWRTCRWCRTSGGRAARESGSRR